MNIHTNNTDIQGRFLAIPYDWRMPTLHKALRRLWQPGGPVFVPKVFGWGWTLNLANAKTWWMLGGITVVTLLAVVLGS